MRTSGHGGRRDRAATTGDFSEARDAHWRFFDLNADTDIARRRHG
jgi:hypothetical protein